MVIATDLTVVLRDEPGGLARVAEVAVSAGVHLRGIAAFTGDEHGFVHALVDNDDVKVVTAALERERLRVADTREVLVVPVGPGGLVDVMIQLAEGNVNVDLAYTALGGDRVVIATDDIYNAREALT
ncbi:hypothetical protein OJ997_13090 [Solirubrobacter phytolaccae]|uniref:ACT domain-containing protein n=1 Tax=Solirubrobacter phytolaccae TaxID=1404360 RepID=A0A9X3S988_9ACTN|nr:hypothetical protein [Solirubrobacter phytolaccae]MDA0181236.1 hypothetical protein [Solirubrobacter phytolaccae]